MGACMPVLDIMEEPRPPSRPITATGWAHKAAGPWHNPTPCWWESDLATTTTQSELCHFIFKDWFSLNRIPRWIKQIGYIIFFCSLYIQIHRNFDYSLNSPCFTVISRVQPIMLSNMVFSVNNKIEMLIHLGAASWEHRYPSIAYCPMLIQERNHI